MSVRRALLAALLLLALLAPAVSALGLGDEPKHCENCMDGMPMEGEREEGSSSVQSACDSARTARVARLGSPGWSAELRVCKQSS